MDDEPDVSLGITELTHPTSILAPCYGKKMLWAIPSTVICQTKRGKKGKRPN